MQTLDMKNPNPIDKEKLTDEENEKAKQAFVSKMTAGISILSDEEAAARDEEIRQMDAENLRKAREENFRRSGIAEKFINVELSELVESGIAEMKDKDGNHITDMKIFDSFIDDIAQGKPRSFWFCGTFGTGKTVFAIALMRELCRRSISCAYFKSHEIMTRLEDVKWHNSRESRQSIEEEVCYPKFRIIDEIGRFPNSEQEKFELFKFTDNCCETFKSAIYISNLNRNELGEFLGKAVTDRFRGIGMTIEFSGKTFRGTDKELYTRG